MTKNKKTIKKNNKLFVYLFPITLFLLIIIAWFINLYLIKDIPERGSFGDMFGGLNALFSGLAFAGVIYAILLQQKELRLTTEQLKGQKEEFEEQNKTMRLQRFENTLFQMLSLHNENITYIEVKAEAFDFGRDIVSGKAGISLLCYVLNSRFNSISSNPTWSPDQKNSALKSFYDSLYVDMNQHVAHYFRSLYRIFLVHRKNRSFGIKKRKIILRKNCPFSIIKYRVSSVVL